MVVFMFKYYKYYTFFIMYFNIEVYQIIYIKNIEVCIDSIFNHNKSKKFKLKKQIM